MHVLFLDIASRDGIIACVDEEQVIASREAHRRLADHELTPFFREVMYEAGWSFSDLTHLACVAGPGGFTSLRVAVAATNALSWVLHIPLCALHLKDLLQARLEAKDVWWLHSTRKEELFTAGFGWCGDKMPDARCIRLLDLKPLVSQGELWIGELIPSQEETVRQWGLKQAEVRPLKEVLPRFLTAQAYDRKTVQPWYGREWSGNAGAAVRRP